MARISTVLVSFLLAGFRSTVTSFSCAGFGLDLGLNRCLKNNNYNNNSNNNNNNNEAATVTATAKASVAVAVPRRSQRRLFSLCVLSLSQQESPQPSPQPKPILCELQTFLKLCELVESGGAAKFAIQDGQCSLNGAIETRRAKKLFEGDIVSFGGSTRSVSDEVRGRGYVYKTKAKKPRKLPKVDADGNLEFGGRYRSEEWRAERKERKKKKADVKTKK